MNTNDWIYYGEWQQPPMSAQIWAHGRVKEILELMHLDFLKSGLIMANGHTLIFKEDEANFKKHLKKAVDEKESAFFDRFVDVTIDELEKFRNKKIESKGIDNFIDYVYSSRRVVCCWMLSCYYSDFFGELLLEKAKENNISDIVNYVPQSETLLIEQHREVLKLKKQFSNELNQKYSEISQEFKDALIQHASKYAWIETHHFWMRTFTPEKLLEQINQVKELNQETKTPPENMKFYCEIAGKLQYIRTYCPEIFNLKTYEAVPLMKNIAKELDLNYDEFIMLTPDEVVKFVKSKTKPEKELLQRRNKYFGIYLENDKEIIIDTKEEYEKYEASLVTKADTNISEIKGTIANKGFAKGRAKIFLRPENMDKMEVGDILITPMTTPDFVPLMKKASGIITDTGGILSHAAIVSRELGLPCVIATKIATQVFKDGDLVEVDADNGVVRKL